MKPFWLAGAMIGIALGLHSWFHSDLISFFPLPLVLSTTIAWTAARPMRWLIALVVISELLTTFLPGILTAAIFLPWLVQVSLPRVKADLSFSFLLALIATTLGQVTIMLAFDLRASYFQEIPIAAALTMAVGTALVAYVFCISWREMIWPETSGK